MQTSDDRPAARREAREVWTAERCFIRELMNTPRDPQVSLALARVEPGVWTQLHRLIGIRERYVVRRGEGLLEVNGERTPLSVGDHADIPAGAAQRILNTGAEDLEFYCLCTPRFVTRAYVDLENRD